jgi:hypothetical protein
MQKPPSDFAAFIGIDWADKKHDVCLSVPGVDRLERSVLEHRPAAIRAWAHELHRRFDGAPIAVSLELSQGPIVSALLEHDFFVLFPVQPVTGGAKGKRTAKTAEGGSVGQRKVHSGYPVERAPRERWPTPPPRW